jgi:hypothetical protein
MLAHQRFLAQDAFAVNGKSSVKLRPKEEENDGKAVDL